ncbi:MAG: hypothetical protein LBP55_04965 [Candidatus Adiutrix sp.]|jgi:broad specificity phosphatase PhoE|nr:hypothetical protein [Candidatus Adiutrix sp.]
MEPDTSPDFTIDDIHKIREWNYERLKDATRGERMADTRKRIAPILAELEAARAGRNGGMRQTADAGAV